MDTDLYFDSLVDDIISVNHRVNNPYKFNKILKDIKNEHNSIDTMEYVSMIEPLKGKYNKAFTLKYGQPSVDNIKHIEAFDNELDQKVYNKLHNNLVNTLEQSGGGLMGNEGLEKQLAKYYEKLYPSIMTTSIRYNTNNFNLDKSTQNVSTAKNLLALHDLGMDLNKIVSLEKAKIVQSEMLKQGGGGLLDGTFIGSFVEGITNIFNSKNINMEKQTVSDVNELINKSKYPTSTVTDTQHISDNLGSISETEQLSVNFVDLVTSEHSGGNYDDQEFLSVHSNYAEMLSDMTENVNVQSGGGDDYISIQSDRIDLLPVVNTNDNVQNGGGDNAPYKMKYYKYKLKYDNLKNSLN